MIGRYKLKAVLELCRISNLPTVISNCTAGYLMSANIINWDLALIVIGASLLYSGGMAMNDVVDAKYDIKNKPDRPIASSKLTVGFSAAFTIGLLVSGIFFLVLSKSSLLWILALVVSIVVYNIIHKKTSSAIYVMGLCRSLLYLVAGYSFGDSSHVLAWAIVLGLYTAGITLVARGEDSETDASKYGYVLIYLPSCLSVYLILKGDSIDVSVLISSLLFLFWIIYCFRVLKKGGTGRIGKTVSFLIAGMCLIDSMAVSHDSGYAGLCFVFFLPVVILFQRRIAGT